MDEADRTQEIREVYENAMLKQRIRNATALPEFRHTCEDCDRVIPDRRRRANPGATRCIKCQTEFECGGNS
jgi:phage/conjugal plasmid C-4 type zinc finger TraR family protein